MELNSAWIDAFDGPAGTPPWPSREPTGIMSARLITKGW
jgi:hypothetical protein